MGGLLCKGHGNAVGIFALICLAACSHTTDPHLWTDWQQLDPRAPSIGWAFVNHHLRGSWQPSADFLFDADWDSLGTADFQALPASACPCCWP